MNILGIITSLTDPASRARIIQYKDPLLGADCNLKIRYYNPDPLSNPGRFAVAINKLTRINQWRILDIEKKIKRLPLLIEQYRYDVIWKNRLILPKNSFFERKLTKPVALDIDDAIWMYDGINNFKIAAQLANVIIAGNEYIAEFSFKYNKHIEIVPSVINTNILFPKKITKKYFNIGWIGSFYNFENLYSVKDAIDQFLYYNNDARFTIVSSEPPSFFDYKSQKIQFKKWDPELENLHINEFSVGIMPLNDNEFNKGKCGYKLLQYLSCGIPAIATPVGVNKNILENYCVGIAAKKTDDWISALYTLKDDMPFYETCAMNGPKVVNEHYSLIKFTPVVADILKTLK
jgi:glycosyltransferase involved in cell wall biosynthesis